MFRVVLFGSKITTSNVRTEGSLELREAIIVEKIKFYKHTAAAEGGITGAGGILLGLADFPLLIGIKLKLLFDIASVYGFGALTMGCGRMARVHPVEVAAPCCPHDPHHVPSHGEGGRHDPPTPARPGGERTKK
jgi:hypothetical protein